jgi:uncharacterized protein
MRARTKQLGDNLLALDEGTMLLEEFDGFVAGLLVCPDLISPGEWLPVIWGQGVDGKAPFDDIDHANFVFGLIMDHYNDVALTLMNKPERYRPLFPVDKDEIIWEVWIEGFMEAVKLRPSGWDKLLDAGGEIADAMTGLLAANEVACRRSELSEGFIKELTERAPDWIPGWIVTLHNHRLATSKPASPPVRMPIQMPAMTRKVGRNERCPCGSGKKYKRCCGLN